MLESPFSTLVYNNLLLLESEVMYNTIWNARISIYYAKRLDMSSREIRSTAGRLQADRHKPIITVPPSYNPSSGQMYYDTGSSCTLNVVYLTAELIIAKRA